MKYQIFQNQSMDKAYRANPNLSRAQLMENRGAQVQMDCSFDGAPEFSSEYSEYWTHVADIEATGLDKVFDIGNIGPEKSITRYAPMRSLSVGDIIVAENGESYMVNPFGFGAVEFEPQDVKGALAFAL